MPAGFNEPCLSLKEIYLRFIIRICENVIHGP